MSVKQARLGRTLSPPSRPKVAAQDDGDYARLCAASVVGAMGDVARQRLGVGRVWVSPWRETEVVSGQARYFFVLDNK
ncbi:uncharacterized protein GLRG_11408 [Colletotrichum graminicola M1.001]|uniref:Uncharacterized protein n=1 Tax=Colletotrichum graminicola (strain M1.001 / M2 / FGSC 10212) TaxID=645133 RepID=E3QZH5_COLGM|nr:uncharacterized protein GLRG_11408 [Colletotrichum graminicola M1.001]EFQ36263.1 hypothetical protein GLRG_11408 [Colletotrichum graminicola M1.001]